VAVGRRATAAVLVAWTLLAVGNALKEGEFADPNITLVVLGFITLVGVVAARPALAPADPALLVVPVLACVVMAAVHPAHHDMALTTAGQIATDVLCAVTAMVVLASLRAPPHRQRAYWAVVIALAVTTGLVIIVGEPRPTIDVWTLLEQSSDGLRQGKDMYRQHWVGSTGLQNVYPYLPLTTVLLAPFRWLLGDVRYGLLGASLLGAWLVRRLAPGAPLGLAALILVVPDWQYLVHQSWTEPILIASIAGSILAMRADRPVLAVIAFAIGLACKQHLVLLLPLFAVWPCFGLRRTAAACGLAVLAVLPWIIAGPHDIWHDAVHANLALGVQSRALNLPSLFARHGGTVGFWFLLSFLAVAYLLALVRLPRTPSGLALGSALVMYALDIANKQTYFNHYELPLGLLVIAVAAAEAGSPPGPGRRTAATGVGRSRPLTPGAL
jgi:hypothetical protein